MVDEVNSGITSKIVVTLMEVPHCNGDDTDKFGFLKEGIINYKSNDN